jgi:hypothetical protein
MVTGKPPTDGVIFRDAADHRQVVEQRVGQAGVGCFRHGTRSQQTPKTAVDAVADEVTQLVRHGPRPFDDAVRASDSEQHLDGGDRLGPPGAVDHQVAIAEVEHEGARETLRRAADAACGPAHRALLGWRRTAGGHLNPLRTYRYRD